LANADWLRRGVVYSFGVSIYRPGGLPGGVGMRFPRLWLGNGKRGKDVAMMNGGLHVL
jgi:hypothetical protein